MVTLNFDMPAERINANPATKSTVGRVALPADPLSIASSRGENDTGPHRLKLLPSVDIAARFGAGPFGGAMVLQVRTPKAGGTSWERRLRGSEPPKARAAC